METVFRLPGTRRRKIPESRENPAYLKPDNKAGSLYRTCGRKRSAEFRTSHAAVPAHPPHRRAECKRPAVLRKYSGDLFPWRDRDTRASPRLADSGRGREPIFPEQSNLRDSHRFPEALSRREDARPTGPRVDPFRLRRWCGRSGENALREAHWPIRLKSVVRCEYQRLGRETASQIP